VALSVSQRRLFHHLCRFGKGWGVAVQVKGFGANYLQMRSVCPAFTAFRSNRKYLFIGD
jgi:hypothetical protein